MQSVCASTRGLAPAGASMGGSPSSSAQPGHPDVVEALEEAAGQAHEDPRVGDLVPHRPRRRPVRDKLLNPQADVDLCHRHHVHLVAVREGGQVSDHRLVWSSARPASQLYSGSGLNGWVEKREHGLTMERL